jgi:hypothetical protein
MLSIHLHLGLPSGLFPSKGVNTYIYIHKVNKLRGLQSESELYRLSDRHLLVKFPANFCG